MSASEWSGHSVGAPGGAPDLRLLPVLAGMWAGTAAVLLRQPEQPLRVAFGAVALLAGGAISASVLRRGPRRATRRGLQACLLAAGALVGATLGALHVQRLSPALTDEVLASSAVVRVVGTVRTDPRQHFPDNPRWGTATTWTAEVRVSELVVRARRYRTHLPIVVRGPGVQTLQYGAQIELTGRAGPPWSPQSSALAVQVLGPISVRAPPGSVASGTNRVRAAFRAAVAGLPPDAGALLLGLAVGDESLVGPDLDEAMLRSGLTHLTAVSGSNTSLVVGLALGAVTALGLGWRLRISTALVVLGAYVALVRPQPSVLRAAAMGLVALLALMAGGRRRGPPALLAAAIVLLAWHPSFALSWGFALSFAATAGLLLVGPRVADRLARTRLGGRLPDPIRAAAAVAVAAHLATLPLAVAMGNGASLVALPANVVVTPFVPYATVVGLTAALVAPVAPPVAVVLAWAGAPATAVIGWVARQGAALPLAVVRLPEGLVGAATGTFIVLVVIAVALGGWRPWRDRRVIAMGLAAALVLVAASRLRDARWPPQDWLVLACDVGQGDAILVRAPDSASAVLVDVGPADSDAAECARDAGVRELVVVLTHFHADHVDGLQRVLAALRVTALLTTPTPDPLPAARHVVGLARAAHVPMRTVRTGDALVVAGVTLTVLWPARTMPDPNNASLVLVAGIPTGAGMLRVLLTGDVEPEGQAALVARGVPPVDVVKVPHHGSSHQDPRLAATARPRIALVSAGADNDYGHPGAATLDQYRAVGAIVGRTDTQGALAVVMGPRGPELAAARRGPAGE